MRMLKMLVIASFATTPVFSGNRILQIRDHWGISTFEQTAIQRAGSDVAPSVITEADGYRMWWCGSGLAGNPRADHIWTGNSADGLNWAQLRMALAPAPLELICDPSVIRVAGTYYMYFTGTRDRVDGNSNQLYLATSQDGEIWTKYPSDQQPSPIIALPAGSSGYGIGQPSALFLNDRFWLYYTDTTREGGGTFLASSVDGISFQPENDGHRLLATNSVDVKYSPPLALFLMVYGRTHDKLYFSTSTDGIQWEASIRGRYLALPPTKNKAFEGALGGSPTGTMGTWTYFYYASHLGNPGVIQDPASWDIDAGRLSFSALPADGTVLQSTNPSVPSGDHRYDTALTTAPSYDYELRAFTVKKVSENGLAPFFRLYHPLLQDHFYTADAVEKEFAVVLGYFDEGILGYISPWPLDGTVPLFRMYHARGDHFYTTSVTERDDRKRSGYRDEGVAGYVWPMDRNPQPQAPGLRSLALTGDPQAMEIQFDTSSSAGAFDVRLELSDTNQGFQFSNPAIHDPLARISKNVAGNSGLARISTEGFPAGRYLVRVAALNENGLALGRYSDSRSFLVGASSSDERPFGTIDLPAPAASTDSFISVEGWALDDQGISQIEILLDGNSVGMTSRGVSRPDVKQVFPAYPDAETSGFRFSLNASNLSSGQHQIVVVLTDTVAQKTQLGPRAFNKK